MQHRLLGRSKIEISAIIFGGWQAGKSGWTSINDDDTIAAHKAAFENGITTFDTAEAYGQGYSERILAQALGDKRDQIVIATKVWAGNLKRDKVIEACERSLKNLGTDRIDLYQIHWPSGNFGSEVVPIEETMGALSELKQQGKIRAIGVSNFSRAQLEEASKHGRVDSLQPPYSLLWRQVESDAAPFCIDNKISILAYSPLAQGLLTGKFKRGHKFEEGDNRGSNKLFQGETYERALNALDKLRPLADKYGVTVGQLSLGWLIAQPMTSAIVGARNAEQAVQNAGAGDVEIDEDDLETIDEIGRTVTDRLDNNPVMWNWGG
ncbi:MAG: aldo/keto reductase [Armatimonadota bacterium]|nr:aldo/keto reductase [Armatimonadota bacterium]